MVVCEIWVLRSKLEFAGLGSGVPSSELGGKVQAFCFLAVWKHRAEKKDFVTTMSCVSFLTAISSAGWRAAEISSNKQEAALVMPARQVWSCCCILCSMEGEWHGMKHREEKMLGVSRLLSEQLEKCLRWCYPTPCSPGHGWLNTVGLEALLSNTIFLRHSKYLERDHDHFFKIFI